MQIEQLEKLIAGWQKSLCPHIELAALISRNNTAHKWKVTYRSIVLRELVLWRFTDQIAQATYLIRGRHFLGARILIRSSIETLAILIYLNQKTTAVIEGRENFFQFAEITSQLMLGSRNKTTKLESINILSVLEKCEKEYPGTIKVYAELSECAHPNYDGVCAGYSVVNEKDYRTDFKNRWAEKSGESELTLLEICAKIFEVEYNEVWPRYFEKLESWLVTNDPTLEQQKNQIQPKA